MESNNNNDFGKIIRNVGLFIGIPLVFFLILWLFSRPTHLVVQCEILGLRGVFRE